MIRRKNGVAATIATASLASLALAGCSNGASSTDASASGAAASDGGAITIEYIHRLPDGEGMTKISELADQWNAEHPDIQVKATKFDGKAQELIKKLETDVKAGAAACLAQVGYGEVPEVFVKGLLEDVTAEAEKYKDNYSGAYTNMSVGGTVVGLPQDTGPLVYYYNKAEFDKLGITAPTTLAEFQEAAKTAAAQGKYIAAFEPDEAQYFLSAQVAAAGGTWYSTEGDNWVVTADSDASKVVADFWQQMLDDKSVLVTERWNDGFKAALNDQSLIGTIGAAWEAPLLAGDMAGTPNEGQWAVAQLPDFGAGAKTGPDGGSGVAVTKGCAHVAEAMEFNNWLNTQVDALVSQGLVVATTTAPMKTPESLSKFYGGQDVFAELGTANANLSKDFPYIPFFSTLGDPMKQAAAAAGAGTGKVADVFTAAQDTSVKALKDGGLSVK